MDFLNADKDLNWGYWAVNGEDHYGLFSETYRTDSANELKVALLQTGRPKPPLFSLARLSSALLLTGSGLTSLLSWLVIGASGMTVAVVFKGRTTKDDDEQEPA